MSSLITPEKPVLVLRTSDKNGRSFHSPSFQWPESGNVTAPDWVESDQCGHGLHGLLWGCGDIRCHPHMFRHSAAVWMAGDRVPMAEMAAFLGDRDARITIRVYARFHPDYLRIAAQSLNW